MSVVHVSSEMTKIPFFIVISLITEKGILVILLSLGPPMLRFELQIKDYS